MTFNKCSQEERLSNIRMLVKRFISATISHMLLKITGRPKTKSFDIPAVCSQDSGDYIAHLQVH